MLSSFFSNSANPESLEPLQPPTAPRPGELPRPATVLRWVPCHSDRRDGWNTDLPRLTTVYVSSAPASTYNSLAIEVKCQILIAYKFI